MYLCSQLLTEIITHSNTQLPMMFKMYIYLVEDRTYPSNVCLHQEVKQEGARWKSEIIPFK